MVEQERLQADFIGRQRFRCEALHLAVRVRAAGALAEERTGVDAAALIAGGGLGVGHEVGRELVLQVDAVIHSGRVEGAALAVQTGDQPVGAAARNEVRDAARQAAVGVVAVEGIALVVHRVADAADELEPAHDVPVGLAEHGLGGRRRGVGAVLEVEGEVGHARNGAGADIGQVHPGGLVAALVRVEGAEGDIDRIEQVPVEAELLRLLPVVQSLQQQLRRYRRRTGVFREGVVEVAERGDRLERPVVAQLVVDGPANAVGPIVVDRRHDHRLPLRFDRVAVADVDIGRVAQEGIVRVVGVP